MRATVSVATLARAILLGAGLTVAFPALGEAGEQMPEPMAPADVSDGFGAYFNGLRAAVSRRDSDGVVAFSASDNHLSFGGDAGHADLRRMLAEPGGEAWAELEKLLAFPVSSDGKMVVTPYWFTADPGPKFDPYFTYFVTGEDVLVRSGPSKSSPAIAAVSHDFVMTHDVDTDVSERYVPVELANGLRGYMAEPYLRSQIDYRAGFEKRDGAWKMIFFIAGD